MTLRAVTTKPKEPLDIARARILDYRARKAEKARLTQRMIDGTDIDHLEREKQFITRSLRFRCSWWERLLRIR